MSKLFYFHARSLCLVINLSATNSKVCEMQVIFIKISIHTHVNASRFCNKTRLLNFSTFYDVLLLIAVLVLKIPSSVNSWQNVMAVSEKGRGCRHRFLDGSFFFLVTSKINRGDTTRLIKWKANCICELFLFLCLPCGRSHNVGSGGVSMGRRREGRKRLRLGGEQSNHQHQFN